MRPQSLLDTNAALIRRELARAGARPSPRRHRLVDTLEWAHNTCDEQLTVRLTHATHFEHLCARCGYRSYHTYDGRVLGHHGGNGLILLRRPDHDGDIVLTDFADRAAYRHALERLCGSTWASYSLFVVSEPQYEHNVFNLNPMRGDLSDLAPTPLRTALLRHRQVMEQQWVSWRQIVSDQLSLPLPPQLGTFAFSDHGAHEKGMLPDGRSYRLAVSWKNDPRDPWVFVDIASPLRNWVPQQAQE